MKDRLQEKITRAVRFLSSEIWRLQAHKLPPGRSFWITQLRIILLAVRRFNLNRCELRASALTFYSLLSIVPVVALAFAIAKGFGLEKILGEQLMERMQGQEEVAERILIFAQSLLENTKGGAIAGVGIVVLLWTVIKVLGNIEKSFNDIWGVRTGRTMGRKFADYLSVMMICPVLLIAASSMTVLVTTQAAAMLERLSFIGYVTDALLFLLKLLPYAVLWLVFTFIYKFMPNTRVELKSALWGGIIGGTIYQVAQLVYITFQIGVSKYGAIYGSFAALPLFLAWLQLSWLIVLFGAEISFARQNVQTYEYEEDCLAASTSFKRLVALAVAARCVRKFVNAETPSAAQEISHELETPIRLVRSVLADLTAAGLLSEVRPVDEADAAYQPARDIHGLTVAGIIERLDDQGVATVPISDSQDVEKLRGLLKRFRETNSASPANVRLQDL